MLVSNLNNLSNSSWPSLEICNKIVFLIQLVSDLHRGNKSSISSQVKVKVIVIARLLTIMAVGVDVSGGGWEGGGDINAINPDLLEYLQVKGKKGVVIDGFISWMDLQQEGVAEELYLAQALAEFSDVEVNDAKASLWKAC